MNSYRHEVVGVANFELTDYVMSCSESKIPLTRARVFSAFNRIASSHRLIGAEIQAFERCADRVVINIGGGYVAEEAS